MSIKMGQAEIVYRNRVLKVTKCLVEKGNKYKVKMTDGRFYESYEEYFASDKEAIESAKRKFRNLCK